MTNTYIVYKIGGKEDGQPVKAFTDQDDAALDQAVCFARAYTPEGDEEAVGIMTEAHFREHFKTSGKTGNS